MKITVFGVGYVGLVTGACLADAGHDVVCVDVDAAKIDALNRGRIPIFEPGLASLVVANLASGRLSFTTDAATGVAHGILQFIAVGTPPGEDGSADLQYVLAVAEAIAAHMSDYRVIVNKSTVPVGTGDRVAETVRQTLVKRGAEVAFDVCSNPEFLKEGAAIEDFTRGPRIVIGSASARVQSLMAECYAPYNRNRNKMLTMDVRSAELTKYAANAMLATKISFMNEMAALAERLGADIEHVRHGIGSDPRIGYDFIYPGCGYGGSCFPKDVQALARTAQAAGHPSLLLHAVEAVNDHQKTVLYSKLEAHFGGAHALQGCTIAVWGLAFKPNTDD
ncbi:MAG: UDP-glucose/GDP-mannose dehydrogenase family protein, partial [Burkholderiaceae bacterium]|nr:UDP-glucose/GDP-mannose dehydrogenase family protein [Burkholderiaceae bacterium]